MIDKPYTISTADFVGLVEITGWAKPDPPEPCRPNHFIEMQYRTAVVRIELQRHLEALVKVNPFDGYCSLCCFCDADRLDSPHADDCPWALARAYLDSLEAK